MRRALAVLALVLVTASPILAAIRPSLRAVSIRPFQVRGLHFKPAERVTVRLSAGGGRFTRVVRATAAGRFTATFTTAEIDHCTGYVVTAQGNRGSRATLRALFVDCPQP